MQVFQLEATSLMSYFPTLKHKYSNVLLFYTAVTFMCTIQNSENSSVNHTFNTDILEEPPN